MTDGSTPPKTNSSDPEELVGSLTLEEKAALTSGADFWNTVGVERAGIPPILLTDGPHGVRKQVAAGDHLGLADSVPATCFPPAVALGSTFDPELVERVGVALGEEARAESVAVLLGPGINIKRSVLCGRNFEYLSEDPAVSGILGSALVRGLQSTGVSASLKHFAANNQETDRLRVSADIDERPLREIYLRAFQRVVVGEQPATVMCSYNRINGVYSSENEWLLGQVLRGEWGFEGLVVSDWGAVNDRVAGIAAGLDLEMPSSGGAGPAKLVAAVRSGALEEAVVDRAAARVVRLVQRAERLAGTGWDYDRDAHHRLAREVASRSIVLLKNEDDVLPLAQESRIAVIGEFARTPRYQGAGSSLINPTRLDNALDALREQLGAERVAFAPGFSIETAGGDDADALRAEAAAAASAADTAVVFLGLPASEESEGFDRETIGLPDDQLAVLDAVVAANPRTVVVLSNGGVVQLAPFADRVPAILEGWLLGQAGGSATADVLTGRTSPSGRLAETIPFRLEDTPAYLGFPGESGHVRYGEGLFVGYRWYDARDADVQYPFGHGLNYTTFDYRDLSAVATEDGILVRLTVTNTGPRAAHEVVQVYTSLPSSTVSRARRELTAFASVLIEPGESREIELRVRREDLAYWDIRTNGWVVEPGAYTVEVGASSRDLRLRAIVEVAGDAVRVPLTLDSTIGEVLRDPVASTLIQQTMQQSVGSDTIASILSDPGMLRMMESFPIGRIAGFPGTGFTEEQIAGLIAAANAPQATL
jgi:beta-glucosidase